MATIEEVARQAGVSTATAYRTFRNPHLLRRETEEKVLEVARRLDFHPHRSRRITDVPDLPQFPDIHDHLGFLFFAGEGDGLRSNDFYGSILAATVMEASLLDISLMVHTTDRHKIAEGLPRMLQAQSISGLLLVGSPDPKVLTGITQRIAHVVFVDHRDPTGQHDDILSDNFGGAYAATQYLVSLGHRKIGFLLDDADDFSFQQRCQGYLCAQIDAGLVPRPSDILAGDRTIDIQDRLTEYLTAPDRPTALFCANDNYARMAMEACHRLGLAIPEDLSLVGFDDIPFSRECRPALTTVRVDTAAMARTAIRRLLSRLSTAHEGLIAESPVSIQIPVSLVPRSSCRAL